MFTEDIKYFGLKKALKYALYDIYWKLLGKHIHFILKVVDYAKALKDDYDFDYQGIYKIINVKLVRLLKALESGIAVHKPYHIKALKLCIKLTDQLDKDYVNHMFMKQHSDRWGELKWEWTASENPKFYQVEFFSEKATSQELKQQESQELMMLSMEAEKIQQRRKKLLF